MRPFVLLLSLTMLCPGLACAESPLAFVDVNVVPMDRECVLKHQTVLVQDKTILQIGPVGKLTIPQDAQRVEGNGTA